jgi:hypothetical protein
MLPTGADGSKPQALGKVQGRLALVGGTDLRIGGEDMPCFELLSLSLQQPGISKKYFHLVLRSFDLFGSR